MDLKTILISILGILYLLTLISVVVVIILENRNPQKAISWIVAVAFIPILGIILYFVFGEEHRRLIGVKKKMYKGAVDPLPNPLIDSGEDSIEGYEKLNRLLKNINDAWILRGNSVEIYSDGEDMFQAYFEDIRKAKHHIHILFYKVLDDTFGQKFKELLLRKVKEGVAVRLIYDDFGSIKAKKKYYRELRAGGVQVATFLPIEFFRLIRRINYRNHRKITVIDGEVGYIGGMNVSDPYVYGISWGTKGIWRDMHTRIRGNAVHALQKVFLQDWYFSSKEALNPEDGFFPPIGKFGNNPMQIVSGGPIDIYQSITVGFFEAINMARKEVWIQTPYFAPKSEILLAIQAAGKSGLDVRFMISYQSDNVFVNTGTFSFVKDLLAAGVKVYMYKAGFIHSKSIIVDGELFIVGSANMDTRSFDLSFETSAFIYDSETAHRAKGIFEKDAEDCIIMTMEEWNKRPIWKKFFHSVMRLFTPVF